MLETIFGNFIEVTLATSVVILVLLLFSKALDKNFTAKWRYWVWFLLAIRLVLSINITLASPLVHLPPTEIVKTLSTMTSTQFSFLHETATPKSVVGTDNDFIAECGFHTTTIKDDPQP